MGSSRLKPLTVKEIEKTTATSPRTIRHIGLGGGSDFVLVHTPAGHASYALRYRRSNQLVKLTLGTTKALTLADARRLAAEARTQVEKGEDPHGEKLTARQAIVAARQAIVERTKLKPEYLWEKYMQIAASQLRSRKQKDRLFRKYILPVIGKRCITEIKRSHALELVDGLIAAGLLRQAGRFPTRAARHQLPWCYPNRQHGP